jgi:uncharacterized OsmC-like protein
LCIFHHPIFNGLAVPLILGILASTALMLIVIPLLSHASAGQGPARHHTGADHMSESPGIRIVLEQEGSYAFKVNFEGTDLDALHTDEPAPLGEGSGPGPSSLLLTSLANCLSASLLFALRKFKNDPGPIRAEIVANKERNAEGRWRIPRAEVTIRLSDNAGALEHLGRVVAQFEQFCIVTQSVREGMDVSVRILDADGLVLQPSE